MLFFSQKKAITFNKKSITERKNNYQKTVCVKLKSSNLILSMKLYIIYILIKLLFKVIVYFKDVLISYIQVHI